MQLHLFPSDGAGRDYDLAFILAHPIPAVCTQGKHHQCRGKREDIHAASLEDVCCFWCGGRMRPVDAQAYQARLATLWQHVSKEA